MKAEKKTMDLKFFKIHFTIKKAPKDGLRYKSAPIDYLVWAPTRKKALEMAKDNIKDFLTKHDAEIKSERCAEIKYNIFLVDPKLKRYD